MDVIKSGKCTGDVSKERPQSESLLVSFPSLNELIRITTHGVLTCGQTGCLHKQV